MSMQQIFDTIAVQVANLIKEQERLKGEVEKHTEYLCQQGFVLGTIAGTMGLEGKLADLGIKLPLSPSLGKGSPPHTPPLPKGTLPTEAIVAPSNTSGVTSEEPAKRSSIQGEAETSNESAILGGDPPAPPSTETRQSPFVPGKPKAAQTPPAPGAATAAEHIEATAKKLASAKSSFKGYGNLENKKTIASRYRRLDMQKAVIQGDVAMPKNPKKLNK